MGLKTVIREVSYGLGKCHSEPWQHCCWCVTMIIGRTHIITFSAAWDLVCLCWDCALIATNQTVLDTIKAGYASDDYCLKIATSWMPGTTCVNGLWYIGDHLLIPWIVDIYKNLFHLVYDCLGHFGANKSYATLCVMFTIGQTWGTILKKPTFYLVRNANATNPVQLRPLGPCTHLLFLIIGGPQSWWPLSVLCSLTSILTVSWPPTTDHLCADIWIIPTWMDISTEDFVALFFNNWFCKNSLLLEIVSDCNKLLISCFWLTSLCSVKLKMSSSYHQQTDGSSKRSNKTINPSVTMLIVLQKAGYKHCHALGLIWWIPSMLQLIF